MKFRIIAVAVALAVLAGIWFAADLVNGSTAPAADGRPDSNDIRNLKIN